MTISTEQNSTIALGNGVSNTFNFSFVGDNSSVISVYYTDMSGNSTLLDPSLYTLFLNPPSTGAIWGVGGTVTYPLSGPPIADGTSLTITRVLPLVQTTSISNQGPFAPQVIESALDTLEMQIQQISNSAVRAIQIPSVDPLTINTILPPAAARANMACLFDSDGNVIAGAPGGSGIPISAAMQPVVQAPTINDALSIMGITPSVFVATSISGTVNNIIINSTEPSNFTLANGVQVTLTPTATNTSTNVTIKYTASGVAYPVYKFGGASLVPLYVEDLGPLPFVFQFSTNINGLGTSGWIGLNIVLAGVVNYKNSAYVTSQADMWQTFVSSGAYSHTLPSAANVLPIFWQEISARTGAITLIPNGTDRINGANSNLVIPQGSSTKLITDAVNNWYTDFYVPLVQPVPYNSISGCLISSLAGNSTTATATIGTGQASDSGNTVFITSAGYSWAVSNGNAINGYSGGTTLPNSSTIHMYLCTGTTGTGVYAIPNASYPLAAGSAPTGYRTAVRRIGSFNTNSSGAPIPYTMIEVDGGGVIAYIAPLLDISVTNLGTSRTMYSLTVPSGPKVQPLYRLNTAAGNLIIFTSGDETDVAPSGGPTWTTAPGFDTGYNSPSAATILATRDGILTTNTTGQIGARATGTSSSLYWVTRGFKDWRRS